MEGDFPCSLLAEAAEERNVVAKHGIVGAGMLHGGIELVFDAGNGLEQELAEIAERFGGLVGDAFLGERGEDFAEDVVYVGDGVEFAGKGSEFGGELFGFKALLFFASVVDAERGMALLAKHAAGTAVGGLAETPVAAGTVGVWIHWNLKKEQLLTLRGRARARRGTVEISVFDYREGVLSAWAQDFTCEYYRDQYQFVKLIL